MSLSGTRKTALVRSATLSHPCSSIFRRNRSRSRPSQWACRQWTTNPLALLWLALEQNVATEPNRVRDGYRVRAARLEPVGLVYLWPATN